MSIIEITITGHPVAKGRARSGLIPKKGGGFATDRNGRPIIAHHTPAKTRRWEDEARTEAKAVMNARGLEPMRGPLLLVIEANFAPPESWPAWKQEAALSGQVCHTSKPDADNILKAVKDAMNGVVWLDDSQVVTASATKGYSRVPKVVIEIRTIKAAPSRITKRAELFNVQEHL